MPETRALLAETERLVGAPVEVRSSPGLPNKARAQLHLPRNDGEHYAILYNYRYQPFLDHLVTHELGHLRRLESAEPAERQVAVSTWETRKYAADQLQSEVHQLVRAGAPEALVDRLLPVWTDGLVSQLTNTPADLCIEREVRDKQPALSEVQERSLLDQTSALQDTLALEIARFTPQTVHRASLLMNYVFVHEIATLYDRKDLLRPFAAAVDRRAGIELCALAGRGFDGNHANDRQVVSAWAKWLGIAGWFEWIPLQHLREARPVT